MSDIFPSLSTCELDVYALIIIQGRIQLHKQGYILPSQMPIHLNGAGRLETKLMEDLPPSGDQQLESGRDALSVLCFGT